MVTATAIAREVRETEVFKRWPSFDAQLDNRLIAGGNYFWCSGHLSAVPVAERSTDDSRYCCQCYAVIQAEKPTARPISKGSGTIAGGDSAVSIIIDGENTEENISESAPPNYETQGKRLRGRPRKTAGELSRATLYWRRKEEQV